jgi:hypothetical protein
MAFILTRIQVGDSFDQWKANFDKDEPGVRANAKNYRIFRSDEDPNEVHVLVEFDSADEAREAREKLLSSGVLDRFDDKTPPKVVEQAEEKTY